MGDPCDAGLHDWQDEYGGYLCRRCREFVPFGCEPWADPDDADDWDDVEDACDDDDQDEDDWGDEDDD